MIKNKRKICYTEADDFNEIQGVGNDPIYKRYDSVYSVIRRNIDPRFHSFLAEPEYSIDDDKVYWYVENWDRAVSPVRMTRLQGVELSRAKQMLDEAIAHYKAAADSASGEDQKILRSAIKFVNHDFVYLIGDKVVLAIWGMKPDEYKHISSGMVIHEEDFTKSHEVTFDPSYGGQLIDPHHGVTHRPEGSEIKPEWIPEIKVRDGFVFNGWSPDPLGHIVKGPVTFTATYLDNTPAPPLVPPVVDPEPITEPMLQPKMAKVTFSAAGKGTLEGPETLTVPVGTTLSPADIPGVKPKKRYKFRAWDKAPMAAPITADVTFTALYDKESWWKRFWRWCCDGALLKFLWFLLLLALLLVGLYFLHRCDRDTERRFDDPVDTSLLGPGVDPGNGIADYHHGVFVPDPEVPPIDNPDDPDGPQIYPNVINVFFTKDDADLNGFITDLREIYPDDSRYLVDFDEYVKRVSVKFPEEEREAVKNNIEDKLSAKYDFIIVDEFAIFNEPAEASVGVSESTGSSEDGWHLMAVNAVEAWRMTPGSEDVTIAVVDDGCDVEHPMFKDKIVKPYNVFTKEATLTHGSGHGTHTAGLAGGRIRRDGKAGGIAPGCKIMPVQVFDGDNSTLSAEVSGIAYAIHNGADVINISMGCDYSRYKGMPDSEQENIARRKGKNEEIMWNRIFEMANAKNVVIVFSAGNDNVVSYINPQNRPDSIISVTAVDSHLKKAIFNPMNDGSNYGLGSTVASPGLDIYSSMPGGRYEMMSGTSMAAPIVAGTIALLKSVDKNITAGDVKNILTKSGVNLSESDLGPMIQADRAVKMLKSGSEPSSHTPTFDLEKLPNYRRAVGFYLSSLPDDVKQKIVNR